MMSSDISTSLIISKVKCSHTYNTRTRTRTHASIYPRRKFDSHQDSCGVVLLGQSGSIIILHNCAGRYFYVLVMKCMCGEKKQQMLTNNCRSEEERCSTSLDMTFTKFKKRYFKGRNFRGKKLSRFRGFAVSRFRGFFLPFSRKFLPRNFPKWAIRESLFPRNIPKWVVRESFFQKIICLFYIFFEGGGGGGGGGFQ